MKQRRLSVVFLVLGLAAGAVQSSAGEPSIREYHVPAGSHPHDVAPAPDGSVWYTAQNAGALGRLDPATGATRHISLGPGSSPHGVIVGPDGAPWVTDSGRNAIIRVDPSTERISVHPLPKGREWRLPGVSPQAYAVYVDETDRVWVSDFGANALVRFDPETESFRAFPLPSRGARIRQILGRKGEVWGAESGTDRLVVIRHGSGR